MEQAEDLSCAELVELVTDYFEGALDPAGRARFEAHLAICDGCAAYTDQMRLAVKVTGQLRLEDLRPHTREALVAAFRGWRTSG
jgi:anti-sigma factor RsiW